MNAVINGNNVDNRVFKVYDSKFDITRLNIILKALDCINSGKCVFCTYWADNDRDLNRVKSLNKQIIDSVEKSDEPIILSISPSASIFEIPIDNWDDIRKKDWGNVKTYLTESHYYYRKLIPVFNDYMGQDWKVKIGIETFDDDKRAMMGKDFKVDLKDLLKYTDSINLLSGFRFQTQVEILEDLKIASDNFEYVDWNILDINCMPISRQNLADFELIKWCKDLASEIDKLYSNVKVWEVASEYVGK